MKGSTVEDLMSTLALMEQTGLLRCLIYLDEHEAASVSALRDVAGSYDSAYRSIENMERLGLCERYEETRTKMWFRLTDRGNQFAHRLLELLKDLEMQKVGVING